MFYLITLKQTTVLKQLHSIRIDIHIQYNLPKNTSGHQQSKQYDTPPSFWFV